MRALGGMADRLLGHVVPRTSAGACACGDCYYTPYGSGCKRCCANCTCTKTTCGSTIYPYSYCH